MKVHKSLLDEIIDEVAGVKKLTEQTGKSLFKDTLKAEIDSIIKESLYSEDENEIDDDNEKMDNENIHDVTNKTEISNKMQEKMHEDEETDETEETDVSTDFEDSEDETTDTGEETEEIVVSNENEPEEEIMDLTGKSDEEVLSVFKKMNSSDKIEITKDDKKIHLKDDESGEEYIITDEETEDDENETMYEFIDDDDDVETEDETDENIDLEETGKYSAFGNKSTYVGRPKLHSENFTKQINNLNEENKKLKSENLVYKKEISKLKNGNQQIQESISALKEDLKNISILKENLININKIFVEHSTTKKEKMNIIERFGKVTKKEDSTQLFNLIKEELSNKISTSKDINQLDKILNPSVDSVDTHTGQLNENKIYESKELKRQKELMYK